MKSIETKALQLIDKYCIILEGEQSVNIEEAWSEETWNKAKQFALIAVDEIIEALKNNAANSASWFNYEKIKQEIQNL